MPGRHRVWKGAHTHLLDALFGACRSEEADVLAFRGVFMAAGRACTVRMSKGDDEMAACGQLGNVNLAVKPAPLLRPPQSLAAAMQPGHAESAPATAFSGCSS